VLAWWENVPLVSWVALRGRCLGCSAWIGWRYVIVEAAVGACWAAVAWRAITQRLNTGLAFGPHNASLFATGEIAISMAIFSILLVGLAALDAEHLWIPNAVTFPGIALGILYSVSLIWQSVSYVTIQSPIWPTIAKRLAGVLVAPGLILLIRWVYWLIRRREGIGLGDAKLMALLAAWLGLPGALLAFAIGVVLGALIAVVILVMPLRHETGGARGLVKLPLGTFLCLGGIVSALWGQGIISAYRSWAGF
jgi:leader peptidase (prepilin peptidase)/N-methyltransferase